MMLRAARREDYDAIAAAVDGWWERSVLPFLPRFFLDHFHRTSLVAEEAGELVGFLIGVLSPSLDTEAYVHFVGVAPAARKIGLARTMYEEFFRIARRDGRSVVRAITSPVNEASIAFHRRLGFTVDGPVQDYNGPGHHLMVFRRTI